MGRNVQFATLPFAADVLIFLRLRIPFVSFETYSVLILNIFCCWICLQDVDDDEGLQRKHKVDTTLQVHFFGKKGNQDLHYEGFYKFMDNLQTEVLELEFYEFSKGNLAITEVDFAKILLRYTYLVSFKKMKFERR